MNGYSAKVFPLPLRIGSRASLRAAFIAVISTGTVSSMKKFLSIESFAEVAPPEIAPRMAFVEAPPASVVAKSTSIVSMSIVESSYALSTANFLMNFMY